MKLRFLCANHKVELANKPRQAINFWQNGFDTGQFFYDQQLWRDALPHIGCAFETSEIIMTSNAADTKSACELFICSANLLADTFVTLGYLDQSLEVFLSTINRLERELRNHAEEKSWINQQLSILYQQVQLNQGNDSHSCLAIEPEIQRPSEATH